MASPGPKECCFCVFVCLSPISRVITFFVNQVFEVDEAVGALTQWKRFISTRKSLWISTFTIPDRLAVSVLFFCALCGGKLHCLLLAFRKKPLKSGEHLKKPSLAYMKLLVASLAPLGSYSLAVKMYMQCSQRLIVLGVTLMISHI